MMWLVAAVLALHPVLDEPATLRLVTDVPDTASVQWYHGSARIVANGSAPPTIELPAGEHTLRVATDYSGQWIAMARIDEIPAEGAVLAPHWVARHAATDTQTSIAPVALAGAGVLALALGLRPKRP